MGQGVGQSDEDIYFHRRTLQSPSPPSSKKKAPTGSFFFIFFGFTCRELNRVSMHRIGLPLHRLSLLKGCLHRLGRVPALLRFGLLNVKDPIPIEEHFKRGDASNVGCTPLQSCPLRDNTIPGRFATPPTFRAPAPDVRTKAHLESSTRLATVS